MAQPIAQVRLTQIRNVYATQQCKNCRTWFVPEGNEMICSDCSLPSATPKQEESDPWHEEN